MEVGRKRKIEDGKNWEELLKNSNIDFSRFLEQDKADAKKAEETLKDVESRLKTVPKDVLSRSQNVLMIDEFVRAEMAYGNDYAGGTSKLVSFSAVDRTGDAECSFRSTNYYSEMRPRALASGSGSGWGDSNTKNVSCGLWFYIPGNLIKKPANSSKTPITVWPYFDIHGFYWVRANDGIWTSK